MYANIAKHYPGKARQRSLATAVTNFVKLFGPNSNDMQVLDIKCEQIFHFTWQQKFQIFVTLPNYILIDVPQGCIW